MSFSGTMQPTILANKGQYIEFFHLVSGTSVGFPAFLTQFEDQFTSEWNEETVFGRMDPVSTFKRTMRKINLGWDIVAESSEQAMENISNISRLIQMLYPSYDRGDPLTLDHALAATEVLQEDLLEQGASLVTSGELAARMAQIDDVVDIALNQGGYAAGPGINTTHISGPPLMKIRFMNLIKNSRISADTTGAAAQFTGLLGYVGGFSTAPMLDVGFIEDRNGNIYPKSYQVTCTFTVLHEHDLGWDREGNFRGGAGFPYQSHTAPMSEAEGTTIRDTEDFDFSDDEDFGF